MVLALKRNFTPNACLMYSSDLWVVFNVVVLEDQGRKGHSQTKSIKGLQARMKFLLALRTLYLSFSRGRKERTSFNHCEKEGAVSDLQLRRISLRANKEHSV